MKEGGWARGRSESRRRSDGGGGVEGVEGVQLARVDGRGVRSGALLLMLLLPSLIRKNEGGMISNRGGECATEEWCYIIQRSPTL